eukprot:scaffold7738_cov133-Cylindrotheca_fusiformis.AAC.14
MALTKKICDFLIPNIPNKINPAPSAKTRSVDSFPPMMTGGGAVEAFGAFLVVSAMICLALENMGLVTMERNFKSHDIAKNPCLLGSHKRKDCSPSFKSTMNAI